MQHKSLFAALLCGTLCLTACLKNEESPSVTTVRLAKATELESIAAKNNADAYATKTLADANAALLNAQAKLEEARAKLQEAEAEKTKAEAAKILVEAELQQVNVELAKVRLDEEKVELERKKAELEAQKAYYDALIAEYQHNKLYWENQKALLEKDYEIALINAEAELLRAKAELVQAQNDLNAALSAYEAAENGAREELRQRVRDTWAAYYNAAADLLDLEHNIIDEEIDIAKNEAGILSDTELKEKWVAKNNREIDRIQQVIDYIAALQQADPEDLKDQLVEIDKQVFDQIQVVMAAQEARDEVYGQIWFDSANQTGLDDSSDYNITYAYTQEFFVPETDEPNLQALPYYYDYLDEKDIYHDGYINYEYDENDIYHGYYYTYSLDANTGEEKEDRVELFSYYMNGADPIGMKVTPKRYPELEEGVVYESYEHNPYTVIDNYEFFPLVINREGYQAYVDYGKGYNEYYREYNKDYWNSQFDYYDDLYNSYIEHFQDFIDAEKSTFEKMDKKIGETIDSFLSDYNGVMADYKAWDSARNEYIGKYMVENSVERTEALQAYQKAYQNWIDLLSSSKYSDLQNADIAAKANETLATQAIKDAEKAKADFEDESSSATYHHSDWQQDVYDAKENLGKAQGDVKIYSEDMEAKKTIMNTAKTAYETAKAKAEASMKAYWVAYQAAADANKAWLAAGSPDPSELKTAKDNAATAALAAAFTAIADQADADSKLHDYESAKGAYETAEAKKENAEKDVEQYQKDLDELLAFYPDSFDKAIKDAKDAEAAAKDKAAAAASALKDYEDKIAAAVTAREDAFKAWKAVAGDDTEWAAVEALEKKFIENAGKLGDPVYELLRDYGVISELDYGYKDEYEWWSGFSYDVDETNIFITNAPYYFTNPDFNIEEYVYDLLCVALNAYFNADLPSLSRASIAWDNYDYLHYGSMTTDGEIIWSIDPDNPSSYSWISPLGVYFLCLQLSGDLAELSANWPYSPWPDIWYEDVYENYDLLSIPVLEELIAENEEARDERMQDIDDYFDGRNEKLDAIMTEVDEILAFESKYTAAIEALNELAAKLPALEIALFEEELKLEELANKAEAMYTAVQDAETIADIIAELEEEIASLKGQNAAMEEAITEAGHLLNVAKGILELDKAEYEVQNALVKDLKAEFEEAFAKLKALTAE